MACPARIRRELSELDAAPFAPVGVTPDQDRWAEALMVNLIHGEHAPLHIAEQIAALTRAREAAGVARWEEIGARLDQLARPEVVQ